VLALHVLIFSLLYEFTTEQQLNISVVSLRGKRTARQETMRVIRPCNSPAPWFCL